MHVALAKKVRGSYRAFDGLQLNRPARIFTVDAHPVPPPDLLDATTAEVTPMERAIPVLPVEDLGAAREFYVDRLGFKLRFEATEDGKSGLLGLERGSIWLTLDCPMSGHGRDACVSLQVDNADALYEEWRQRVEIRRVPRNEPWGARTFDVIDPFGNTIFVMGPTL